MRDVGVLGVVGGTTKIPGAFARQIAAGKPTWCLQKGG